MTRLFAEPLPARLEWNEDELGTLHVAGSRLAVVELVRRWRVEAEWWANGPERDYYTVRTADGLLCDVYADRRTGECFLQRIFD